MAISFEETPQSRAYTHNPPSYTLIYNATGEHSDLLVQNHAIGTTPALKDTPAGILYRQDIKVDPVGWKHYLVTVSYGPPSEKDSTTGSFSFDFDTSGGTVKIKTARQHVQSYEVGGPVDDIHRGAIGVTQDGDVEGVDVIIPALKLVVKFTHPAGIMTIARVKQLSDITGTINAGTFLTFARGELLFAGASGGDGTETDANVNYTFIASANAVLTMGDIAGITKYGHHYAWVEYEDTVQDGKPSTRPLRVHVEQVYQFVDWRGVFGWG